MAINAIEQVNINGSNYNVSIPFVIGSSTDTTAGTWTGSLDDLTEYYDGLLILYKPAVAGASTTTLNINNLGAKTCYLNNTTKLTTHYPKNQPILLAYSTSQNSGCWECIDNYDSNSNTYDRNRYQASIKAGSTALVAANIIVGKDGVFNHLKSGGAFDISYPILYLNENVAANKTTTNTYDIIHFTVTTTQSISLTAYLPVYIKGTLSGTIFTPVSTTPLTQSIPVTDDGYQYIYLGNATAATTIYLQERHPIYEYKNGVFGLTVNNAKYATGGMNSLCIPGNYITAEGTDTWPSGNYAHAEGVGSSATGDTSHAEGYYTYANGIYSHAEGCVSIAAGGYSHAEGYATSALGVNSHACGNATCAVSYADHAEGAFTTASGNYSHSCGVYTLASGEGSYTEGYKSTASGAYSHAEGGDGTNVGGYAIGIASHAEGVNTSAIGEGSHAEGGSTTSIGGCAIGNSTHAEGKLTIAIGINSHAEGHVTTTVGINSHAEGYQTCASGANSHAEGNKTYASDNDSHAEGYLSSSTGANSHAEGYNTLASGVVSHAEGSGTSAVQYRSHAEGYQTYASGYSSHAEGYITIATGETSHAQGSETSATGIRSHTEGFRTSASGYNSHAEGYNTIASGGNSHVEGAYNVEDLNNEYAHIIGGGLEGFRKNIFTVNWSGDVCANSYGPIVHNAITHRNVYRGKNLGSTVTTDQYNAIDAGTFEDLYIGDYWVMDYDGTNTVKFYIVDFDPYIGKGSSSATATTKHHVMLFPSKPLPTQTRFTMEAPSTNDAGYKGCNFRLNVLPNIITKLNTWFGQDHILKHPESLSIKAGTSGPGASEVVNDCTAELFSVINIFGYQPVVEGSGRVTSYINAGYTLDLNILPLFRYTNLHTLLDDRNRFVFRDIENTGYWMRYNLANCLFARIADTDENAYPYFLLCKSNT